MDGETKVWRSERARVGRFISSTTMPEYESKKVNSICEEGEM